MKVIIQDNDSNLDIFTGDGYNFYFYNHIPFVYAKTLSTYDLIDDFDNSNNDEILLFNNNKKIDTILNNFIWYARTSLKPSTHIDNTLFYFKNTEEYTKYINGEKIDFDQYENNRNIHKINKSVIFSPHWGWTDFVISVSLVNYYSEVFNDVTLLVFNEFVDFVKQLFPNNKIVSCSHLDNSRDGLALIKSLYEQDYIFLMDGHQCTQNIASNFNHLKLNGTSFNQKLNNFLLSRSAQNLSYINIPLINHIKYLDITHSTFDERHSFYTLAFFDKSFVFEYFNIIRNCDIESQQYNKYNLKEKEYIVINRINEMNRLLNDDNLFELNYKSKTMLDMLKIIENSKEIHIYDSLYGMIIYLMYFKMKCFQNNTIYYHRYARKKIHKFFDNKLISTSNNWRILD